MNYESFLTLLSCPLCVGGKLTYITQYVDGDDWYVGLVCDCGNAFDVRLGDYEDWEKAGQGQKLKELFGVE